MSEKNTITIAGFKKLTVRSVDSPAYGKFMIGDEDSRKRQHENIAVGDTVFYLESEDAGVFEGTPQINISIEQATLV
jgi:hypothetical protein